MLKKTIAYTDFNGDDVVEEHYFHLSKAELIELEMSHKGGLSESLKEIVASEDGKAIIAEFKNIILLSYGQRSEDGRHFIKNQTLRDEFESSEAYSTLFVELVTDAEAAATFISGVIPRDMAEEAAKLASQTSSLAPALASVPESNPSFDPNITKNESSRPGITRQDLLALSKDDFIRMQERIDAGEVDLIL